MKHAPHTKIRISITILPFINTMLEKVSEQSGVSKSGLVEQAIKIFLQKQLDKDSKALARLSFDDLPSEDEWLSVQSSLK